MIPEVIKFYRDKHLEIPKLITKRPADVMVIQVEVAADMVYNEIRAGLKIKDINIARYVWATAKGVNHDAYIADQKLLENYKGIISEKNDAINGRERRIKELLDLQENIEVYAWVAAFFAVVLVVWEVICIP